MAPRIPKQNARFFDVEGVSARGRSVLEMLRGYAGAPSQASVMRPGETEAYGLGETAGVAEMLIPGASMAKGALGAMLAGVIKPRGGNWLTGGVESSISNLFERLGETDPQRLAALREQMGNPELGRAGEALGRWIEGPLTKYIKRDMATPEDPVRKLAEEGILHYDPIANDDIRSGADYVRKLARDRGFPSVKLGKSDLAQRWENLTDIHLEPNYVGKGNPLPFPIRQNKSFSQDMEWLERVRNAPEESQLFGSYVDPGMSREVGFNHLVDELSNAMNPESGLPRNLLLRPEQMQQMGMEKAVRHVDAINKWRAAQQAAANTELANKAAVLREYPDTPELPNPKGLRWVELSPDEELAKMYKEGIPSGAENAQRYKEKLSALEKQLKYEGDTMGHCVGGYCPEVLEGRSRIFSLRDVKGEPHVTVEVGPGLKPDFERLVDKAYKSGDHSRFEREFDRINGLGAYELLDRRMLEEGMGEDLWDFTHYALRRHPETMVRWAQPSIKQVKGKQNLAPKDEYLPFVQDFVRNSPLGTNWGQVGDLKNTGLRKVGDKYVTPDELKNVPKTADGLPIGYQPLDDLPEWRGGGLVTQPDYFDDLDAFLGR